MGERWDSNPQQQDPQSCALPIELRSPCSRLAGLEPATHNLEGCCSIQLSYRRSFGMVRFELTTPWSQTMCATQLRYIPVSKRHNYEYSATSTPRRNRGTFPSQHKSIDEQKERVRTLIFRRIFCLKLAFIARGKRDNGFLSGCLASALRTGF